MKPWMWTGAGVGVLMAAGVAVAQVPPTPPPGGPQQAPAAMDGERGPAHDGMGMDMHGPMMDHGHGHGGWMMRHMMEMHRPPPPSKAAHFRFRKGDAMVDIKCADDEPTKACVDAGSALLDKLAAQPK